jgi:3-oxoacyl-[acyl-carrier-protein] synthase-3
VNFEFRNASITGILTVVPSNTLDFFEEMDAFNFPPARSRKLAEVMGFSKHKVVVEGITSVDLAVVGFNYLFEHGLLKKEDVSGIIFVTQSPDFFIPANSHILHGLLDFSEDVFCLDITQGCAGYIIGLIQAFLQINSGAEKIVLVNADTLSSKVSKQDRNSWPLIGDAAAITIIERVAQDVEIKAIVKFRGAGRHALQIPAGAFREPSSEFSKIVADDGTGNLRSRENLIMDGSAIFNFVQENIPPLIQQLVEYSGISKTDFDYFVFHQPNKFMLEKLAQKMEVPQNKVIKNVVESFGNSSGVTIPLAITHNLSEALISSNLRLCLAGFGVGLTWGAMDIQISGLDFCQVIED